MSKVGGNPEHSTPTRVTERSSVSSIDARAVSKHDNVVNADVKLIGYSADELLVNLTSVDLTSDEPKILGSAPLTTWELPTTSRYRGWRLAIKRAIDIVGALVLLTLLAPVLAVVALAVVLESPGGVFFTQTRVGRSGNPFQMLKFRSMYVDAEERLASEPELLATYVANDYKFPESADPRITRLGTFLRKSSLDELPQLFSVLTGQMSLVGPRPVVPDELVRARSHDAYVHATPGITGVWQVEGRSTVGYPERCEFDNRYVADWSVSGDIRLLVRTIPAVVFGRGAH